MKRNMIMFLVLVAIVLIGSCAIPTQKEAVFILPTWEQFLAESVQTGTGGSYVVEGDIELPSLDAVRYYFDQAFQDPNATARGARSTVQLIQSGRGFVRDVFPADQKRNLTFAISTTFGLWFSRAERAMLAACAAWERYADIEFKYCPEQNGNAAVDGNPNVNFIVRPAEETDDTYGEITWRARSALPSYTTARSIKVNIVAFNSYDADGQLPYSDEQAMWEELVTLFTHEVGHVLGLRHEHIWGLNADGNYVVVTETGFPYAQLLTELDQTSIMGYDTTGYPTQWWSRTISPLDATGIQIIYGANPARYGTFFIPAAPGIVQPVIATAVLADPITFQAQYTEYTNSFSRDPYQIDNLNVTVQNNEIKYSCIFTYAAGETVQPRVLILNASRDEFVVQYNQLYPQGYRIKTFDTFIYNNTDRYAAVMEYVSGFPDESLAVALDANTLVGQQAAYRQAGYSVKCFSIDITGLGTAVFTKSHLPSDELFIWDMSRAEFLDIFYEYADLGYWPSLIDSQRDAVGRDWYAVVLVPQAGYTWTIGWELKDLEAMIRTWNGAYLCRRMTIY